MPKFLKKLEAYLHNNLPIYAGVVLFKDLLNNDNLVAGFYSRSKMESFMFSMNGHYLLGGSRSSEDASSEPLTDPFILAPLIGHWSPGDVSKKCLLKEVEDMSLLECIYGEKD